VYQHAQHSNPLSDADRRQLEEGSAISPEVLEESGARTIRSGRELPKPYSGRQRRRGGGILFPVYRPNGDTSWSFRPDRVDPDRPGHKYEAPCKARGGPGNVLGVLPSQRHLIADKSVPVVFVEGQKKQLSLISAARKAASRVLVVAVSGVWNWMADGKPIPDLADTPLEGRRAAVMNDSDMLRNESVQDATKRFAEYLEGRGAAAFVTYFRDNPDGSKVGADDFFAGGGTWAELRMLTRRYDPADFARVRLSRSERLRRMLEDLHRTYAAMPAAKIGECSDRATMRELLRRAREHGKPADGGLVVRAPVRPLSAKTRLGRQGQANSLRRLQANGYLERIEEPPHKVEKHGTAYLLKASTHSLGRAESGQGREGRHQQNASPEQSAHRKPDSYADLYTGVHSARATSEAVPELRHSKVVHTWARRNGRRVVVHSDYIYRLAKPRQEVLMYLLDAGGEASEAELLERFGSKSTRPRDFHRRKVAPLMGWRYSRDKATGAEQRLETGPQIVTCEGGVVRILPEWREALEEHRKQSGELEDNQRQEDRYEREQFAYRTRDRTPADKQPAPLRGKEEMRRIVAEGAQREQERWVEEQRQKVGETAATFLADELEGITAVRFKDVRDRWALRGGRVEDLRLAVQHGPFRFKREEDGDLYVHHADAQDRPAGPNDRRFRERMAQQEEVARPKPERLRSEPPMVDGIYQHGATCGCWICADEEAAV
jgi:uncharacterized protein DUF3854